jgi:parallel beta-helix repeat protein
VAWGNDAGIALEGASRNVVRGNLVAGNRVGLRLKDVSSANILAGNAIVASSIFGIVVNAGSVDNAVGGNRVFGGKAGIVVNGSTGNHVDDNAIAWIIGRGVVLTGAVGNTSVTANTISGRGTAAIDVQSARDLGRGAVTGNAILEWVGPRQFREIYTAGNFLRHHPAIGIWLAIFLVPLAWWLPARRRRLLTWRRSSAATGAP